MGWTGSVLDGTGTPYAISVEVSDPQDGRRLVGLYKREGADFIKVHDLLSRDVYLAVADEAKRGQTPLVGHPPFSSTVVESSDLWSDSARSRALRDASSRDTDTNTSFRCSMLFCPRLAP